MEKWGRILLLILNFFINACLVLVAVFLVLWLVFGKTPSESVQGAAKWIETKWDSLTGRVPQERIEELSEKQRKRAHRNLYIEKNSKHDETETVISQPYK